MARTVYEGNAAGLILCSLLEEGLVRVCSVEGEGLLLVVGVESFGGFEVSLGPQFCVA